MIRNIGGLFYAFLLLAGIAPGATISLSALLSGPNEFPPNASTGTGFASIIYDSTAHTLALDVTFSGLTGTTTASHIHCCVSPGAVTPTAGVATTTPTFAGFPLGVTAGTYQSILDLTSASSFNPSFVTAHGGTLSGAEAFLASGFANGTTYLNIHTNAFPGGEIRGFLTPEPASLTLAGTALIALWLARRRRRAV